MTLSSRKYHGKFTKKISVSTNDPKHPQETLLCKGHVQVPLNLSPRSINFGQIPSKGGPHKRITKIVRGDGGPLNLKLEMDKTKGIKAKLNEIEPGERYELEVILTPPLKSKKLRTKLKLHTGIAGVPIVSVPIYATIAPRVVSVPRRFTVPSNRPPNWEQTVKLRWDDDKEHKIISATIDDPQLKVRIEEKGGKQLVVLQVPEQGDLRRGARTVIIKTDDAETPTVRVPISFKKAKKADRRSKRKAAPTSQPAKLQPVKEKLPAVSTK